MNRFLLSTISFFAGALAVMCATHCIHQPSPDTPVVVKVDTVIMRDTVREILPVPKFIRVVDTALVAVHDTLSQCDTLYFPVPITQAEYEDSSYHAWVSGYRPSLDSIHVFQQTQIIRETVLTPVRKSGWGFSVGFGPAVIWTPFTSAHIDGGIGVYGGVSYTF